MCATSMVGDHYNDHWQYKYADLPPSSFGNANVMSQITRQEFDALKVQVSEMVSLLKRAKKYDEDNNEPHCEVDEKMALLRRVALAVGVDLNKEVGL